MREGSSSRFFCCSALKNQDRLFLHHSASYFYKLSSVFNPFHIQADHPCLLVFAEVSEEIHIADIDLVSHEGEFADSDFVEARPVEEAGADASALGHDRDAPSSRHDIPFKRGV